MSNLYSSNYYAHQKDGSYASAEVVVPLVLEYYRPKSLIDVGCGVGNWLAVFQKHGVEKILGLDGDYVDRSQLRIQSEFFKPTDLSQSIIEPGQYDMAMSLEVAEHLPAASAEGFVGALTRLAPVVLFSAAVPFQGGTGHVNEQWPEYWVALFAKHNYIPLDPLRKRVWNNSTVDWWYAQNILFFVSQEHLNSVEMQKLQAAQAVTFPAQLSLLHPRSQSLRGIKHSAWPLLKKKLKAIFFK